MNKNIGVDPSDLLGLQSELATRLHDAHKKQDSDLPKAIAAILAASPGRRKLFTEGRLFQREGAILLREPFSLPKEMMITDKDPRAMKVLHIDWDKIKYKSFVEPGQIITGNEKLARMKQAGVIRLDWSWAFLLKHDHDHYNADSVLEHLYRTKGIEELNFFGTILGFKHSPGSDRQNVRVLRRNGTSDGQWRCTNEVMNTPYFGADSMSPIVELAK